jgi:alpha-ribazole phosphatase
MILLIRHGRTPGNEAHRYNGVTDEALTDAGRAALAEKREQLGFPAPELVYVTRYRRTRETAAILFPAARQITVPGLREMDFGDFEGRNYHDMEHDAAYRAWVDSGCTGPVPNGECRADFLARIGRSFRALLLSDRSERITVVAHGGTLMAVCTLFVDPTRDYFDWQPKNGGGYLLRARAADTDLELLREI